MTKFISIIVPNFNGSATLRQCLRAAVTCCYDNFEIIVVDDCSSDDSVNIIKQFPCQLIELQQHAGAAKARNIGADYSRGDILFFTDADCLLLQDSLTIACKAIESTTDQTILGGSYTRIPFDNTFFSLFQSIFIHHSETRNLTKPDYVATHAMVMDAHDFQQCGGFDEDFLPILEDVEFSHRVKHQGYKLAIVPNLLVQHIFNFSFRGSLLNAITKSKYWVLYSINNGDLLNDSGTASRELKTNVVSWCLMMLLLLFITLSTNVTFSVTLLLVFGLIMAVNLTVSKELLLAFYRTGGILFFSVALFYYIFLYPAAVAIGALIGTTNYLKLLFHKRIKQAVA